MTTIDGSVTGLQSVSGFEPTPFYPPLLNPTGFGLYAAVGTWQVDDANRFVHGVDMRSVGNFGGENSSGVWGASWCGRRVVIDVGDSTGGTLALTVDDLDPISVAYHADAGTIQTDILALDGFEDGDVTVTSSTAGVWVIDFRVRHDVAVDGTDLTGGAHTVTLTDEMKTGTRSADLDPFLPTTVWAYDQCDLTEPSRAEIETRVQQTLRLEEQTQVEREFAARLLLDAAEVSSTFQTATSLAGAVGFLEAQMALTNTIGFFHVGAQWVAETQPNDLFLRSGTKFVSPMGHTWVIGGGYVDGLDNTIVATSQPFGWRSDPTVFTTMDQYKNLYAAIAERSVLVGYEHLINAVTIST
jgi:hypothetical protein